MGTTTSQITSLTIVYSTVSGADQRKHQSSASLAFVRGIHRWLVNYPHKWPVTRKMAPLDDVIMLSFFQLWRISPAAHDHIAATYTTPTHTPTMDTTHTPTMDPQTNTNTHRGSR